MGLLSPSKYELEARIDVLENNLESMQRRMGAAEERLDEAGDCVNQLQKYLSGVVDQYDTVEDKDKVVETLDEPKIGWKATENYIAKLLIPEDATVVHPYWGNSFGPNKKRTDTAIVVQFYEVGNRLEPSIQSVEDIEDCSQHDSCFTYKVGETVTPDATLDKRTNTDCTSGIHFFCSQEAAIDWL